MTLSQQVFENDSGLFRLGLARSSYGFLHVESQVPRTTLQSPTVRVVGCILVINPLPPPPPQGPLLPTERAASW